MGKRIVQLEAHDGLLDLLRGDARIVSGLPADATLRNVSYDGMRDVVLLLIESESYPAHEYGQQIPIANVLIETKSARADWTANQKRLELIATRAVQALPAAPRHSTGIGTDIYYKEFKDTDEAATAQAIAEMAAHCEGVTAYVALESPVAVEHVAVGDLVTGPYVRLVRLLVPFPDEGEPRMITYLHVGVVRDGA